MSELSANKIQINFNKSIKNSNKKESYKYSLLCSLQTLVDIKHAIAKTKPKHSVAKTKPIYRLDLFSHAGYYKLGTVQFSMRN